MFDLRGLSVIPIAQARGQFSTMSHCVLMMLHMLWQMTTLPLYWKVL